MNNNNIRAAKRRSMIWKALYDPVDNRNGAVAQLGERVPCTDEVGGSTPLSSTTKGKKNENTTSN